MIYRYEEEPFIIGKMGICFLKTGKVDESLILF